MIIIDGNGDGPGPGDCRYEVTLDGSTLVITPSQDAVTPVRACTGSKSGSLIFGSDSSSDFAVADLSSTASESSGASPPVPDLSGLLSVPVVVELVAEAFGPPDGLPLEVNQISVRSELYEEIARALPCSASGPALQLNLVNGPSMLLQLSLYPDAQNPTHLSIPNLPFEQASPNLGSFTFLDVYMPVTNRAVTAALATAPGDLLVNVELDRLSPCPGRTAAPTTTEWAFVAMLLSLLAFGCWRLGRRRAFYQSLPTV